MDPARYGAVRHPKCAEPDRKREDTDYALLDHVFGANKPKLAICYGNQLLNVSPGGSLIQDIPNKRIIGDSLASGPRLVLDRDREAI